MVMASQCILQQKPKSMRITIDGKLERGVTAKDVALYLMSRLTTSGATGYFVEYSGSVVRDMSMEGRLTLCNLSIEMGARGGFVAPDETTFEYIRGREFAPKGEDWDKAVEYWKTLKSGDDAVFDSELHFDAAEIEPMVTYGTNPGMGMGITQSIPTLDAIDEAGKASFRKSLDYLISCFLVHVPMGVLKIFVLLPLSSRVGTRPALSRLGLCPVRGPLTVRYARRGSTRFLRPPVLPYVSRDARLVWR